MIRPRSSAAAYGAGMEQPRPLILVDVDGVLNPARSYAPGYRRHWVFPGGLAHRLLLNPSHGQMLTELAGVTGAELVWASYWRNRANTWVAPRVGLPSLRFVPIPPRRRSPTRSTPGSWKARHVALWVGQTPFVWFEDDADAVRRLTAQPGFSRRRECLRVPRIDQDYRGADGDPGNGPTHRRG
jgi:HAD domain in Swiss Army Knife RNA repair proteins